MATSAAGLLSALRGGCGGIRAAVAARGPFELGSVNRSALQQLSSSPWLRAPSSKPATLRHFSSSSSQGGGGFRRGGPGSADRNNRGRGEGNRGNNNNGGGGGGGGWGFIGERNTRGGGSYGNGRGGSSRDTNAPSWLSGTSPSPSPSSSSSSPPPRLRRPLRFGDPSSAGQYPPGSSPIGLDAAQRRPHLVALFPGDYSDDPGNDEWDNDDDFDGGDDEDDNEASSRLEAALRRNELEMQRKRERWIQNAIPPVWTSVVDDRGRSYGRGGRKRAQARVWIQPGLGTVTVNRRHFEEYFTRMSDRDLCLQPMVATATLGHFDVTAIVKGGGLTGQAGAIRHGVARALNAFDPDRYRADLKVLGLLTRDARKVERKKIGHKKARKSPQWVRR
jgi:small subunit ribosomal protein S9